MAYIGRQLARGENKLFDDISSSFNGSTTTFTLAVSSVATATATPYQLFVSLGGVMQKPNTDFTTAGNQITFTTAPAAGLSCWIMMQGDTIDNAAVADASITPSKISGTNFAFSGDLRLKDADGSHYVGFASPTTVTTNKVWTLPAADGGASTFLQTNGSGVLSWSGIGGASGIDFNDNVKARFGTGNDLEIFHNASNSVINDAGTGDLLLQVGGSTKATVSSTGLGVTGALTVSTNATISGNLTVSGTTTTVDSVTLSVKDKNIEMGVVSSPSDTTADGGGITLKGASDKSFNWVNATDAWTSSEHIHLLDNKKLFVGGASGTTDGLEIVHNGSNSILNDSGTGTLQLQLGGSTKLEVTSGGINVTGAISVGGSPLSTSPSFEAVASGTLPDGRAVILNSNGTVTAAATSGPTYQTAQTPAADSDPNYIRCERISTNQIALIWRTGESGNKMRVIAGTISSGTITFGSVSSNSDASNPSQINTARKNIGSLNCVGVCWREGSAGAFKWFSVAANNTITWSDFNWLTNSSGNHAGMSCGSAPRNGSKWVVAWTDNNNGKLYARSIHINGDHQQGAFGTTAELVSNAAITYISTAPESQSTSGVYGLIAWVTGSTLRCQSFNVDYSNGNTSLVGSAMEIRTSGVNNTYSSLKVARSIKSSTDNEWLHAVVYYRNSDDKGYVKLVKTRKNSTAVVNGETSGSSHEFVGDGEPYYLDAAWGSEAVGAETLFVTYMPNESTDSNYRKGLLTTASATGFTNTGDNTDIASGTLGSFGTPYVYVSNNIYRDGGPAICDVNAGGGVVMAYPDQTAGSNKLKTVFREGIVTNVTATNVVGFSNGAYSNGQTAKIDVIGSVTTQSSLTVGSRYYVQNDGTLSTTADSPSIEGGKAISTTKLLITIN